MSRPQLSSATEGRHTKFHGERDIFVDGRVRSTNNDADLSRGTTLRW